MARTDIYHQWIGGSRRRRQWFAEPPINGLTNHVLDNGPMQSRTTCSHNAIGI